MKSSLPPWKASRGNGSEPDRVLDRLEALDGQLKELEHRRASLDLGERALDHRAAALEEKDPHRVAELERISSLSTAEARRTLIGEVEADARRQAGLVLRRIESAGKAEAEGRARGILATATQRLEGALA